MFNLQSWLIIWQSNKKSFVHNSQLVRDNDNLAWQEKVRTLFQENPENLQEELQAEARNHPYAMNVIKGHLADEGGGEAYPMGPASSFAKLQTEGIEPRWVADIGFIFTL